MKLFNPSGPLYKVMWVACGANIVWDMEQEKHFAPCSELASLLNKYLDIQAWAKSYEDYYRKWLTANNLTIYNLDSPLVASMLDAIEQFNKLEQHKLYYWFDVDRLETPDFHWQSSPLSDEALLELPASFSAVNHYIALTDCLVFPANSSL